MDYQLTALGISVLALHAARQLAVPVHGNALVGAALDTQGDDAAANARRMG